ncbi:MAG: regulatory protein GemA [Burkholderiales bacterium]|nr:regulatory protein GemA [Burkholderiales bacterium]
MTTAPDIRKRELAQIHIAKAQLGMDDETYRAMLWTIARVKSAADLDWAGRKRVLDHFKASGAKLGGLRAPRAAPDRAGLVGKIGAQLTDMSLPWAYAHGMAKHMFKLEKVEWCSPEQLRKIVAALAYKQKKGAA